jgi:translocation and assembly module TamB
MNWGKWIKWVLFALTALALLLAAGGLIAVNTAAFHQYVLAKIEQEASQATGGKVDIRNYDFKLLGLTANAYGVVIRGTEPGEARPLLSVDRLTVKLKILSVLHRNVNLNELVLEHPVVRLRVNQDGKNNLPNPEGPQQSSSSVNLFDLAVGRAAIERGEIYYNDQPQSLDAELRDLQAEVTFSAVARQYDGSLGYHDGHVRYGPLAPLPHTLEAKFSASPGKLSINPLMTLGGSRLQVSAEVRDFDNPYVSGKYDILLHAQDFRKLTSTDAAGDLRLRGGLEYQAKDGRAGLNAISLNGDLASGELMVQWGGASLALNDMRGRYALSKGRLSAQDLAVRVLGGELLANLSVNQVADPRQINLHANLKNISIDQLKSRTGNQSSVPLGGAINGSLNAESKKGVKSLQAHADLNVSGRIENHGAAPGTAVPIAGAIHADYSVASGRLALHNTELHTPATTIQAQGEVSDRSSLALTVEARDLREVVSLATAMDPKTPLKVAVAGSATVRAMVTGSMQAPQISAQVASGNLRVDKTRWKTAEFQVKASPSSIAVQNGMLVSADKGELTFKASSELQNWSYSPQMLVAATVSIENFPAETLQALAGVSYPVHGNLSGSLNLNGTREKPAGTAELKLADANIYGQSFSHLQIQTRGDGTTLRSTLNARTSAGNLGGNIDFAPKTEAYQVHLEVPQVLLAELEPVKQRDVPLTGTLNAVIDGHGTIADPQLTARVQIPQLQYQRTTLTGVHADLTVANHRADISLASGVANATVGAKASVKLTGDYEATGTFDTTSLPIVQLASLYLPSVPSELQGETEVHASFNGPLRNYQQMEAHLTIAKLSANYQNLHIENAGPIRADIGNEVAVLRPSGLKGTGTNLSFEGQIPLQSGKAMRMAAQGNIDIKLLRLLSPDLRTSGNLALDVRAGGEVSHPSVNGTVKLEKISLATISAPLGLEQVNGLLTIANDQVQITQLEGQMGGGKISAGGSVGLRPELHMNVALKAQSIRLRYPEGVREVLNTDLTLSGTSQSATLDGRVLIDSLSFTQDFDMADFIGQFSGSSVPSAGNSLADRIKLNLAIQSTSQLEATSSGLSIEGSANLRLIGTAGDPVIVGRADLNSGEIFFMKKRYQLERGVINFTNPNRTTPVVNMLITTTVKQYNISLTVIGPIDKLRTSYVSDPPLPPVDIINLIARGQTTEEAAPSSLGANSVLAQGLASQVSGQVEKLAGLSSVQIDPLLGGDNTNPGARVAIQQRVTRNFLFTFSTDLTSAQSEVVKGEYQINKRWSVSVTRDESGGFSVDGKFHTNF